MRGPPLHKTFREHIPVHRDGPQFTKLIQEKGTESQMMFEGLVQSQSVKK